MDPATYVLLGIAGLAGGFVGGLLGVGGGVIFTPILYFYFESTGVPGSILPALSVGSSLFCTTAVAAASTAGHARKSLVDFTVALQVGLSSIVAIYLTSTFVTTATWYSPSAFRTVFAFVLLTVSVRMLISRNGVSGLRGPENGEAGSAPVADTPGLIRPDVGRMLAAGSLAGTVATSAGVGGGIVLVPLYNRWFRFPIDRAIGTSSATIILITLIATIRYMSMAVREPEMGLVTGYVDLKAALLIAIPAVLGSRFGVRVSHRTNRRRLKVAFAVLAIVVAARMLAGTWFPG